MGYIYEQKMSQETKDYLESLHLKKPTGRAFDYSGAGPAIIDEETQDIFFGLECHFVYPLTVTDYILVYKKKRVIMEVESAKMTENRVLSIRIPEAIEREKEEVVKKAINLFFEYHKLLYLKYKRKEEEIVLDTNNIRYYK